MLRTHHSPLTRHPLSPKTGKAFSLSRASANSHDRGDVIIVDRVYCADITNPPKALFFYSINIRQRKCLILHWKQMCTIAAFIKYMSEFTLALS